MGISKRKIIEKNLKKALLEDGRLVDALFEYELAEHVGEYLKSKKNDRDKYFFAVTEHTNDVAMLLIDESILHTGTSCAFSRSENRSL
jgi:hypothetical protein